MTGFIGVNENGPQPELFGETENLDPHIELASYSTLSPPPLNVISKVTSLTKKLGEEAISYMGELPIEFITQNSTLSRTNWTTRKKIKTVIGVTNFVKPLVLDADFKIIDGELRLELVKELQAEGHYSSSTVPVVIYNVDSATASFLRIALNRMGEFARWDFKANPKETNRTVEDIPEFLDANPQLQKMLEPFGFWADNLLSDEFFKNTVLEFTKKLEPLIYTPEIGLAAWAVIQTERNNVKLAEEAKSPLKAPANHDTIFNLVVTDDDYIKTYAIDEEVEVYTAHMKDVAGIITDAYDIKRRAEKMAKAEERGEEFVWQNSRRAPKQVIVDKKIEVDSTPLNEVLATVLDDSFNDSLGEELNPLDDEALVEEIEAEQENSEDNK